MEKINLTIEINKSSMNELCKQIIDLLGGKSINYSDVKLNEELAKLGYEIGMEEVETIECGKNNYVRKFDVILREIGHIKEKGIQVNINLGWLFLFFVMLVFTALLKYILG